LPSPPGTVDDLKRDIELLAKHLPLKSEDRTLIVLKGHLLVENLLTEFIVSKVPDPSHLEAGQFRFPQRVALAQMFAPKGSNDWVWDALRKLNSLRNTLAHRLEAENAEHKLNEFLKSVPPSTPSPAFGPLPDAIINLYFGLADHLRFKTYQDLLVGALRNWKSPN
jgi:hypothetical protein